MKVHQTNKRRRNAYLILLLLAGCHAKQVMPSIDQFQFSEMRVGQIKFNFPSSGKDITSGWEKRQEKRRLVGRVLVFRNLGGSLGKIGSTYAFAYIGTSQCEPGSIGSPVNRKFDRAPHRVNGSERSVTACFERDQELEIVVRSEPWPEKGGEQIEEFGDQVFATIFQSMRIVNDK